MRDSFCTHALKSGKALTQLDRWKLVENWQKLMLQKKDSSCVWVEHPNWLQSRAHLIKELERGIINFTKATLQSGFMT